MLLLEEDIETLTQRCEVLEQGIAGRVASGGLREHGQSLVTSGASVSGSSGAADSAEHLFSEKVTKAQGGYLGPVRER
ncbi:MAG: hypothetical protein HON23_02300 [Rickettsiales bacterium]|nr:hypothetical protein [Rickettsiales bacterium]